MVPNLFLVTDPFYFIMKFTEPYISKKKINITTSADVQFSARNQVKSKKERSSRPQMSIFSLEPKCIFLSECCRLILSNASALADPQQAFHGPLVGNHWFERMNALLDQLLYHRPSISRRETRDFTQIFHASVTLCDWLRLRLARFANM